MRHARSVSLLALLLATGACRPDVETAPPDRAAPDPPRSGETAAARPVSQDTATPARPATDTARARGDRTPQTDPWLFEGIPNFEDVVALREGDWMIVLASATRPGPPLSPTILRSRDARLAAIQQRAWNAGEVPWVVASEELPAFAPGLTVLVLGPYPRAVALERLAAATALAPDAYVKSGW